MIPDSRELVSEQSQYSTLAAPSGLDPEGTESSRSLAVGFKEPWMRLLFHSQPPVHPQHFEVFSTGRGGRKKKKERKESVRGVFLSVLFKCLKKARSALTSPWHCY